MYRSAKASDKSIDLAEATIGGCCFVAGGSSTDTIRLFVDSDVDSWAASAFGGSKLDLSPTAPSPDSPQDGCASTASWSPPGDTIRELIASLERRSRIIRRNSSGDRSPEGRRGAAPAVAVGLPAPPSRAEARVPSFVEVLLGPGASSSAGVSAALSNRADRRSSPAKNGDDAGSHMPKELAGHRSVHAKYDGRPDEELPRPWLARIVPAPPRSQRQTGGRRRGQPDGGRSGPEKTYGFGGAATAIRRMTLDEPLRQVPRNKAYAVPLSRPAPPPPRMLGDLPAAANRPAPPASIRAGDPPPPPPTRLDRAPRRPQRQSSRESLEPLRRGAPPAAPAAEEAGVSSGRRAAAQPQ
jgi:hypothetical protein